MPAVYNGDANFAASTSPALTQSVRRPTTTVVTSNRIPTANLGQNITFTATVRPVSGTGTPTGTVRFTFDGGTTGVVATLNLQGRAIYTTSTLSAGNHTVIATYNGSAVFAGGVSTTFIQTVNQAATTTVVTSNTNPSVSGRTVTFTARVTPSAATGTVQFSIDGIDTGGPVALDATGRARLVVSTLTVGTHTIVATFSGSTNYTTSISAGLSETVNKANSRTVVTTSGTPAAQGTTVILTATVTAVVPGVGVPTGSVQFVIDGNNVGPVLALNTSGQTAYASATIPVGRHTVSAVYTGDANFNASTSNNITQRIV